MADTEDTPVTPTDTSGISIPISTIVRQNPAKFFPHITPAQVEALKTGQPLPPSPEWWKTSPELEELRALLRAKLRREDIFAASIVGMPSVACIMVFGDKARLRRARKAVNQFVAQSYPHKELILVNSTDQAVTNVPHPQIKEIQMAISEEFPSESVGMMRNFGIAKASAPFLFPVWDDDDIYDCDLLSYLMVHRRSQHGIALTAQIRIDIVNSVVYVHYEPAGIPNTMLLPNSYFLRTFDDATGNEDVDLWQRITLGSQKGVAIDNKEFPLNSLKMCVHDGNNVLSRDRFMVGHSSPVAFGKWDIDPRAAAYVLATLAGFGIETRVTT